MKIQEKHLFHGAALAQIVEHPSFKALNKADHRYGHYQINHDRRVVMKHTTKDEAPWQFTFTFDDLTIWRDSAVQHATFVCLVCGTSTVCLLSEEEFEHVLDTGATDIQWIRVESPAGASMRVRGSRGELSRTVPHKRFPDAIFVSLTA